MIYLDYAATSLKRVELIEYIMNNMMDFDANADSIHKMGRLAKKTLENSRHEIAKFLNTSDDRIVFTSGASESNNYIINNFSDENYDIITSKIEHPSILNPLDHNKSNVILIDAQQNGVVDCDEIIRNITPNTKLIILQHVNNETGAIQPVKNLENIWRIRRFGIISMRLNRWVMWMSMLRICTAIRCRFRDTN